MPNLSDSITSERTNRELLGTMGSLTGKFAARASDPSNRYRSLYSPIGKYLGGMAGNLLSGRPTSDYLTSTLGNLGQIIGSSIGGEGGRWAGPTGQMAGTALSSLLQGRNPLSTIGTPTSLGGYLGAMGAGFGGKTGGLAGTIGGNVLGNVYQGYRAGTNLPGILSNIGGLTNLANLGIGALPYLLPKDMPPPAKGIISTAAGTILPTLAGTAAPTLASLGLGITGALGATPIGAVALPITLGYNIYSDLVAQKKIRKADERQTAAYNQAMAENWEKFAPLYDQIKAIGQQRLSKIGDRAGSGLDPTTGLTQEEMVMLFGRDYTNPLASPYLFSPATQGRSSYSKYRTSLPYERGLQILMGRSMGNATQTLNYDKIIPWLKGEPGATPPGSLEVARGFISMANAVTEAERAPVIGGGGGGP